MAHSGIAHSGMLGPQKRSWVQTQWSAGETPAGPLPMSSTWGSQLLVRSGLPLCFKKVWI
jgi:hypothetical protein